MTTFVAVMVGLGTLLSGLGAWRASGNRRTLRRGPDSVRARLGRIETSQANVEALVVDHVLDLTRHSKGSSDARGTGHEKK